MKTEIMGTVVNGALNLDERIGLPEQSRVRVTVEPVSESRQRWNEALERLKQLIRERPIRSGGRHFTREELHERR